jgi:glucose/arabinose dehydrogenase
MNILRRVRAAPAAFAGCSLGAVGPVAAPASPWQNRPMRPRLFFLLLGVPTAMLVALVLLIRAGQSDLRDSATRDSGGAADGGAAEPQAARRGVRLVRIGRFESPVYVTAPPRDRRRIFVVEQTGRIRVLVAGKRRSRPFLDLSGEITSGGERGLLGMAFAPDYASSGRFYVDFTDRNGHTRVQEFRRSARSRDRADRGSRRGILFVRQPYENHNGGQLAFGPDGYLYVGMGDGGSAGDPQNNAQNLDSLLGKILRIDPRPGASRAPSSNPFVGRAGRDEIFAYGLRNPWRFSFDRKAGDLYIGDVGQDSREEVDYLARSSGAGRNLGWSCFEGRRRYESSRRCPNPVAPVLDYGRGGGECSVTGGYVVRDPNLDALAGRYVYGDFCAGKLRSFRTAGGKATGDRSVGPSVPSLSSFGEDARGRVYATSLNGPVYRLRAR